MTDEERIRHQRQYQREYRRREKIKYAPFKELADTANLTSRLRLYYKISYGRDLPPQYAEQLNVYLIDLIRLLPPENYQLTHAVPTI